MSAPSEVFDQIEVPEIVELAGGKKSPRRRRSCPKGQRRSQTTGRCRRPCPQACKGEADDEDMLLDEIDDLQQQLEVARREGLSARYSGAVFGEERSRARTDAELAAVNAEGVARKVNAEGVADVFGPVRPNLTFGGGEMEGGARKRKLSMYNKFVMKYAAQHRGKTGKSLIRSAARAWRAHKGGRSMSRSRSPSKRSHSRSRSMRR